MDNWSFTKKLVIFGCAGVLVLIGTFVLAVGNPDEEPVRRSTWARTSSGWTEAKCAEQRERVVEGATIAQLQLESINRRAWAPNPSDSVEREVLRDSEALVIEMDRLTAAADAIVRNCAGHWDVSGLWAASREVRDDRAQLAAANAELRALLD